MSPAGAENIAYDQLKPSRHRGPAECYGRLASKTSAIFPTAGSVAAALTNGTLMSVLNLSVPLARLFQRGCPRRWAAGSAAHHAPLLLVAAVSAFLVVWRFRSAAWRTSTLALSVLALVLSPFIQVDRMHFLCSPAPRLQYFAVHLSISIHSHCSRACQGPSAMQQIEDFLRCSPGLTCRCLSFSTPAPP